PQQGTPPEGAVPHRGALLGLEPQQGRPTEKAVPRKPSRENVPAGTMATVEVPRQPAPRQVRVAADGSRVAHRAGAALWVYEPGGTPHEVIRLDPDVPGYAIDARARIAVFSRQGRLYRADLSTGAVTELPTAGPARDARPDPTGQRIGYLTNGALHVV